MTDLVARYSLHCPIGYHQESSGPDGDRCFCISVLQIVVSQPQEEPFDAGSLTEGVELGNQVNWRVVDVHEWTRQKHCYRNAHEPHEWKP